jgi:hypothetical protein
MASVGGGSSRSGHKLVSYRRGPVARRSPQTASFRRSDLRGSQHRGPSNYPSLNQSPVKSRNENSLDPLRDLSTSLHNHQPSPNPNSSPEILHQIDEFLTGSRDKSLELKVPKIYFNQVSTVLESADGCVRYTYNWIDETLTVYPMPSAAHEALLSPITFIYGQLVDDIKSHVPEAQETYLGSAYTDLEDAEGSVIRVKGPDSSIDIKLDPDGDHDDDDDDDDDDDGPAFPLIVFEVGVSEDEADLDVDARHWLYETRGKTVSHDTLFSIPRFTKTRQQLVGIIKFFQPANEHKINDWEVTMKFYQR